jgi:hypothetical protein
MFIFILRAVKQVFRDRGYTLWTHRHASILAPPGKMYPLSSGFGYATPGRKNDDEASVGTVHDLLRFQYIVCFVYQLLP